MKILVLNGSPKGPQSVTMQSVEFLDVLIPDFEFEYVHAAQKARFLATRPEAMGEIIGKMADADLVLWAFPLYFQQVSSQYKRFIELVCAHEASGRLAGTFAAALSTSIHFFDHAAHEYIRAVSEDLGLRFLGGFSAEMHDLLKPGEQDRLADFARLLLHQAQAGWGQARRYAPLVPSAPYRPASPAIDMPNPVGVSIGIVAQHNLPGSNLAAMIERFRANFMERPEVIDLSQADIRGGCLGCIHCGYSNTCRWEGTDGYVELFKERVLPHDVLIFAAEMRDRGLAWEFKQFMDRSFFNTHQWRLTGKQIGYLVSGPAGQIPLITEMLEGYCQWQHANFVDLASDGGKAAEVDARIDALARRGALMGLERYVAPPTFPGVAGLKIFRDEIWGHLRPAFMADHRFYRAQGLYRTFPQRQWKSRLLNRLLSALMLWKGFRGEFTRRVKPGMIARHQKVVARLRKDLAQAPEED